MAEKLKEAAESEQHETYFYKLRMNHSDISNITSESVKFNDSQSASSPTHSSSILSTSLPSTSYLASKFGGVGAQQQPQSPTKVSPLLNSLNGLLKQAAYQFHLIFQTKTYNANVEMIELANHVNQHLQHGSSSSSAQYFCLPQCLNMSKYLMAKLFYDKYYLC
jgi:hypothetical protein